MSVPVIGWREWVELPEWDLHVLAKIDTGAKSSSIDAAALEFLDDGWVRFQVRSEKRGGGLKPVMARLVGRKRVRSSNGQLQERVVVKTTLVMAGVRKEIEVNLTCRKKMLHRMLLGRTALAHDFLIDANRDGRKR